MRRMCLLDAMEGIVNGKSGRRRKRIQTMAEIMKEQFFKMKRLA